MPLKEEIWIVEGSVTDPEAYDGTAMIGDTEWQFSDGPAGKRGSSSDFLSLEEGIRSFPEGTIFHFDPAPDPETTMFEAVVTFRIPLAEILEHQKVHQEVWTPQRTFVEILQSDLYDAAGLSGDFTVVDFKEASKDG